MEENNKNQSVSNHIRKQCVSCFLFDISYKYLATINEIGYQ